MNHILKSLLKMFMITSVLLCHVALAEDIIATDDPTPNEPIQPVSRTVTKTLCPSGQYVYKCGNYQVGFNWLKSAEFTTTTTSGSETTSTTTNTKDYYISDDMLVLLDQMRIFFKGDGTIKYKQQNDENEDNYTIQETSAYTDDRNLILNQVCNPFNSSSGVTCAYCPNSAKIDSSTVKVNSGTRTASDWVFHTVADCYIDEFEDLTGKYEYVLNEVASTAEKCYYTNTNAEALSSLSGDAIGDFSTTTSTTTSVTGTTVYIPTSSATIDAETRRSGASMEYAPASLIY